MAEWLKAHDSKSCGLARVSEVRILSLPPRQKATDMAEEKRIEIYKGLEGEVIFDVDAKEETIWATQEQITKLFGVDRTVIGRHLNNIFRDGELDKNRVCAKNAHTGPDGKTYQVKTYNLDAIISVGYRVNSKKATQFRIWATSVLKKYVVSGAAVNVRRLEALTEQKDVKKLRDVEEMMGIVKRLITRSELGTGEANGVIEIISRYAGSFKILKEYDDGRIDLKFMNRRKTEKALTPEMCMLAISQLKKSVKGSESFGKDKNGEFIKKLPQIFNGLDKEASVPEKAANLLYFIIKNKPFEDGNKRIGALLFVLFLTINNYHLAENGETKISDRALTALALLIAESEPKEKELVVDLVCKLLE